MLTIQGGKQLFCGGVSRRSFLQIGGLSMVGFASLGLADIVRAETKSGAGRRHKSVINIFLAGGPPHQDMWDLKMSAPAEVRGEFKPIPTNVDGLEICEVFPKMAKVMDRVSVLRAVVGNTGDHDAYQCMTGWRRSVLSQQGGYPSLASVSMKVQGSTHPAIPAAVGLAAPTTERRWSDSGSPGFLGSAYAPFKPFMVGDQGRPESQKLVAGYENGPGIDEIRLKEMTLSRLNDRRRLLSSLDEVRRDLDHSDIVSGRDAAMDAAFDVLTSSKLADALDISREPEKVRERYGDGKPYQFQYDGSPTCNDHLLMARRLVEAGVRVVTLSYGRWDSHGKNFDLVRHHGPRLDQCVSALIEDLDQRGMLDDVAVVVWGEFGRTPKINENAGRDHWPQVNSALLAGGGMRHGQVIGSTTSDGGEADSRPVHMQEIMATLYHSLGLNTETLTLEDRAGRPTYLLDEAYRQPIRELTG